MKFQNRDWLYQKYIVERKTLREITDLCGVRSKTTIWNWIRRLDISPRTKSESATIRCEKQPMGFGENHIAWKGGRWNYFHVLARRVWSEFWNEKLPKGYLIHHVDGDIENNNITNLAMLTPGCHTRLHRREK